MSNPDIALVVDALKAHVGDWGADVLFTVDGEQVEYQGVYTGVFRAGDGTVEVRLTRARTTKKVKDMTTEHPQGKLPRRAFLKAAVEKAAAEERRADAAVAEDPATGPNWRRVAADRRSQVRTPPTGNPVLNDAIEYYIQHQLSAPTGWARMVKRATNARDFYVRGGWGTEEDFDAALETLRIWAAEDEQAQAISRGTAAREQAKNVRRAVLKTKVEQAAAKERAAAEAARERASRVDVTLRAAYLQGAAWQRKQEHAGGVHLSNLILEDAIEYYVAHPDEVNGWPHMVRALINSRERSLAEGLGTEQEFDEALATVRAWAAEEAS